MIDIHNHLLPGLDDGAQSLEQALALAQIATEDGITHVVCTPHIHPGLYDNTFSGVHEALRHYDQALTKAGSPLQVAAAAEMHFSLEILQQAQSGDLPFLGKWEGKDVLLLEFPHTDIPFGAIKLVSWLVERDILPMIAHPERNQQVIAEPQSLAPFLEKGCLLQLTASSLTGHFGAAAKHRAEQLLIDGEITCLATDAHNSSNRPPVLSEGVAAAEALIGAASAEKLSKTNPWRIVSGQFGRG